MNSKSNFKKIKQVLFIYSDNTFKGYNLKAFTNRFMIEFKGRYNPFKVEGILKHICKGEGVRHYRNI